MKLLRLAPQLVVAALAVVIGLWIADPGVASDFGIVHFTPVPVPSGPPGTTKRIFTHPFWRQPPPHFSDLQTLAIKWWDDVKTSPPALVPVQDQLQTIVKTVDYQVQGATGVSPPPPGVSTEVWLITNWHVWMPKCPKKDCKIPRCNDKGGDQQNNPLCQRCDHNERKDNPFCPKPGPSGVPEPRAWLLALVGFGLLGAQLRAQRPAAGARSATSSR
jgi:hypothetical protein